MDTSQNFPLIIPQGATVVRTISYQDSDESPVILTGYSAKMQFRDAIDSTGDPVIDLSTANGLIVIAGTAGTISFTIPAATTAELLDGRQLVYDLFIYSGASYTGIATRLLSGQAVVSGSVTQ